MLIVHNALWMPYELSFELNSRLHEIARVDDPKNGRYFARTTVDEFDFVTQNMYKPTRNTDWVKKTLEGHLTWLFPSSGGSYAGRIMTWREGQEIARNIWLLNPDKELLNDRVIQ